MAKKRKKSQEEVELNLAAMLDMAFQILTFFILIFKPQPTEGEIQLRMPPPQPVVIANKDAKKAGEDFNSKDLIRGLNTLVITALGSANGSLAQITVGDKPTNIEYGLAKRLQEAFGDSGAGFDQVIIQVGSSLHYKYLMEVIKVCTQTKLANGERLSKLSFVELPGG